MSIPVILSHCRLTSQPDLSDAPFTEVDYHANDIRVVHQEYLPRGCKSVDFGQNKLAEDGLPFQWPDQIEQIFLYDNLIVHAHGIRWPTSLKVLDLYNNPLISMPRPISDSIEELILSKSDISMIDKLPESLKEFHMTDTRLIRLPVVMPQGLLKAILAENVLSFRGLPGNWGSSLQYLDLAHNKLKTFPIGLPDTLEVLILTHNKIKIIPANLPEQLKQLTVNRNHIRQIEYSRRKHPLELACLENNQLVEKPSQASYWAKVVLDGGNWNETHHQIAAHQIQKFWRVSRIFPRIRAWYKMAKYKEELFIVSLHPDRILKTDDFSKWHFGC
jgi:Leucine-rich repeat (LRR) protein